MSLRAESPTPERGCAPKDCTGCGGEKGAPIAAIVYVGTDRVVPATELCEECGRDAANAIGFMCVRDGGWSKLEPRKRKSPRVPP